jgi:hypothetical protein
VQAVPQLIPAGLLVTVPKPLPDSSTLICEKLCGGVGGDGGRGDEVEGEAGPSPLHPMATTSKDKPTASHTQLRTRMARLPDFS